jgi:putative addiction module CopG family antidote
MQFEPTADQQSFIQRAVASGRYRDAEEAVRDAMARWEEDERTRIKLLAAFDEAEADLQSGEYADYTNETLPRLARELKQEARAARDHKRPA